MNGVRPPPFLMGATLLFWGFQTGLTGVGAIMALIIELPRLSKTRYEISQEDFSRVWVFCSLLLLASVVYAFTLNEGPSRFAEMLQDPDLQNQSRVSTSGARTAASLIRWQPLIFFLFMAAQQYSSRGGVPVETVSLILRRRWKKAKKLGLPMPPSRSIDISYIYFILCIFSSSIHTDESKQFFWGAAALTAWALWPFRSRRFGLATWSATLVVALAMAWFGQRCVGQFQHYLENLNPQWLSVMARMRFDAFQAKTSLGQIGRLKSSPLIVIRVEGKDGPVPQYLREASYSAFRNHTWFSGGRTHDFERVDEEPPGGVFSLVSGKTNIARVQIACFLPGKAGLLPLPASTGRLTNLPAFVLQKNPYGAVYAEGPGLVIFDALFGPGPMVDSPPDDWEDLGVPTRDMGALDQVIEQLDLSGQPQDEVMNRLEEFFAGFTYSTWQEADRSHRGRGEPSALSRFLLETKKGHCEYFATATVLLLHRLGIPARYAVGYVVHERASGEKEYVVRLRDAHAWCMVWDSKRSVWKDFDTTPASWLKSEDKPGWPQRLADAWSRLKFEFLKIRWGQTHLRQYILWTVIPILAILLGQIIFSRRKRAGGKPAKSARADLWPGLDSEFYELEKKLAKQGFTRQPAEPVSLWLQRSIETNPALADSDEALGELLRLHYRYRFDPAGLNNDDRASLRRRARELVAKLEHYRPQTGADKRG